MAKVSKKEHAKLNKKFKKLKRAYKHSNKSEIELQHEYLISTVHAHNLLEIAVHMCDTQSSVGEEIMTKLTEQLLESRQNVLDLFGLDLFGWDAELKNNDINPLKVNSKKFGVTGLIQFFVNSEEENEDGEKDESMSYSPIEDWFETDAEVMEDLEYRPIPNNEVLSVLGLESTVKLED